MASAASLAIEQLVHFRKRKTYHVCTDLRDKNREYAYWHRVDHCQVVEMALSELFEKYPMKPLEDRSALLLRSTQQSHRQNCWCPID